MAAKQVLKKIIPNLDENIYKNSDNDTNIILCPDVYDYDYNFQQLLEYKIFYHM